MIGVFKCLRNMDHVKQDKDTRNLRKKTLNTKGVGWARSTIAKLDDLFEEVPIGNLTKTTRMQWQKHSQKSQD